MNLHAIGFAGMAVAVCAVPAVAHHSFAMFDAEKTMSIEGTVKEFQWTNPHSWIHLMVADSEGKRFNGRSSLGRRPAWLGRAGFPRPSRPA
jgi:hypothetical protein